jgi:hypothetical protein
VKGEAVTDTAAEQPELSLGDEQQVWQTPPGSPPLLIRAEGGGEPVSCTSACMAEHMARHLLDPHYTALERSLAHAINHSSGENGSDTPDFILARMLATLLDAFGVAVRAREKWYGVGPLTPGASRGCPPCPDGLDDLSRRRLVVDRIVAAFGDGGAGVPPGLVDTLANVCEQLAAEGLLSKARW